MDAAGNIEWRCWLVLTAWCYLAVMCVGKRGGSTPTRLPFAVLFMSSRADGEPCFSFLLLFLF